MAWERSTIGHLPNARAASLDYAVFATDTKRNANSKVVEMILKPKGAMDASPAEPVLAIGS